MTSIPIEEEGDILEEQVCTPMDEERAVETLGVDPALVQARIQNMTAEELQAFNDQVNEMEAGGSALGVIVLVLLLLILLDLLGVTDVFPGIHPA